MLIQTCCFTEQPFRDCRAAAAFFLIEQNGLKARHLKHSPSRSTYIGVVMFHEGIVKEDYLFTLARCRFVIRAIKSVPLRKSLARELWKGAFGSNPQFFKSPRAWSVQYRVGERREGLSYPVQFGDVAEYSRSQRGAMFLVVSVQKFGFELGHIHRRGAL